MEIFIVVDKVHLSGTTSLRSLARLIDHQRLLACMLHVKTRGSTDLFNSRTLPSTGRCHGKWLISAMNLYINLMSSHFPYQLNMIKLIFVGIDGMIFSRRYDCENLMNLNKVSCKTILICHGKCIS